jgi:hypothetical protein
MELLGNGLDQPLWRWALRYLRCLKMPSPDAENESREPRDRPQCCLWEEAAMDLQRFLIGLGLVILVVGVLWPMLSRIGIGRLPGDIMFQRGGATFYFPLATSIIVSIVLSVLFWLFNR